MKISTLGRIILAAAHVGIIGQQSAIALNSLEDRINARKRQSANAGFNFSGLVEKIKSHEFQLKHQDQPVHDIYGQIGAIMFEDIQRLASRYGLGVGADYLKVYTIGDEIESEIVVEYGGEFMYDARLVFLKEDSVVLSRWGDDDFEFTKIYPAGSGKNSVTVMPKHGNIKSDLIVPYMDEYDFDKYYERILRLRRHYRSLSDFGSFSSRERGDVLKALYIQSQLGWIGRSIVEFLGLGNWLEHFVTATSGHILIEWRGHGEDRRSKIRYLVIRRDSITLTSEDKETGGRDIIPLKPIKLHQY